MTEKSDSWDEGTILELFHSGKLTAHIFSAVSLSDDRESFSTRYAELHNRGAIDFLSLADGPEFDAVTAQVFFLGQHLCCDVIPRLIAPTSDMMRFVDRLVKKGGEDLASNQPNGAFRQWCVADLTRASEVMEGARANDPLSVTFLTFALEAGQFFDQAKEFIQKYDGQRRLSAITAVARMKLGDPDQVQDAFEVFHAALAQTDDVLFANVLRSAFEIAAKCKEPLGDCFGLIVSRVCESPGPQVNYSCAQILWLHTKLLTADLFASLAKALALLDPSHKATVNQMDLGLRNILDTSLASLATDLLEKLLITHPQALKLSEFDSFGHRLLEQPEGHFQRLLVKWLISGKQSLCDGLRHLLSGSGKGDNPINLSSENLPPAATQQIFLCRKAVGYFFLQPVCSASVVVSVLRICSEETSNILRQLLFDPLLRNYGGKLREFLVSVVDEDAATAIKHALEESDRYLADIKSVGEVKEMWPSERQRQAVHRNDSDEFRRSHKEAMKKSVFMNLVHRSVILYGRRTLTFVQGPGNERRLMEMDLQSHSFGWELPRTTIIDPVGLDFMLRIFRTEKFRHETHSS
jgi:hypothetical protein